MAARNYNAPLSDQDRDNIIMLSEKKLRPAEIAGVLGVSKSVVLTTTSVYQLVKSGDYDVARKRAYTSNNNAVYKWACNRAGVDPETVAKAGQKPEPDKSGAKTAPPNQDAVIDAIMALANKQTLCVDELLKKLDQIAVIVQSCTKNIQGTINTNADIIHTEQKKHTETMNGIKCNTRKTVWKGEAQ